VKINHFEAVINLLSDLAFPEQVLLTIWMQGDLRDCGQAGTGHRTLSNSSRG
jgi:hypothetical protein